MARRIVRVGKKIDYKEWGAIPFLSRDESTVATFQGAAVAFGDPATLLRCRGYVEAAFDETAQAGDEALITFGLGFISSDAFAAAATPDPLAEPNYPWVWWGQIFLEQFIVGTSHTAHPWGPAAQRMEVDSKAMRKISPQTSLAWQAEVSVATGAPTIAITFGSTRFLFGT